MILYNYLFTQLFYTIGSVFLSDLTLGFKFVTSLKYSKLHRFFYSIPLRNPLDMIRNLPMNKKICDEFHKYRASRDVSSIEEWIFINTQILSKKKSQNLIKIKFYKILKFSWNETIKNQFVRIENESAQLPSTPVRRFEQVIVEANHTSGTWLLTY